MTRPEDELFIRFRATGDPAALAAVFDRVAPDLLAVALHICSRRADAEDLVQDTFLVAIERAATWDPGRGLFPWLVGILTHRRHRQRRSEARTPDPDRLREPTSEDPAFTAQRRELDSALSEAVASLGDVYRPVLHLYLRHGLDAKEIAEALGRPHGTVRTQVVRALQRLRELLPTGIAAAFVADAGSQAHQAVGVSGGLASVRAIVLESARTHPAAAATAAVSAPATFGIGLLMTKQAWLVAGALLLASALWYTSRTSNRAPVSGIGVEGTPSAPLVDLEPQPTPTASPPAPASANPERAAVAEAAPPASGAGAVTVRVIGVVTPPGSVGVAAGMQEPGLPLVGVTVELWSGHGEEPPLIGRRRVLQTDENGVARFAELVAGPCTVDVVARPADPLGGAQWPHFVEVSASVDERLEVTVPIISVVQGRVVDEAGAPIAEAEIWAGDDVLRQLALPQHILRRAARSGTDGTFRAALATHEERIAARKEGYADSPALTTAVLGGADVDWTLVLRREFAHVRGTVRDGRNRPIGGLAVALQRSGDTLVRRTDGIFEQGHLPLLVHSDTRGDFAADLAPGDYECRAVGPSGSATARFHVAAGEAAFVELAFPDAVAVHGTVRTPAGAPVPTLPVWIDEGAPDGKRSNRVTRTLSDGSFLFLGVPRRPFVVEAGRFGGRLRARAEQPAPTRDLVECVLTFDDPAPIQGRVLQANGAGAAGLTVSVRSTSGEHLVGTTSDADGRFALHELDAGPYRLFVTRALVPGGRVLLEFEGTLSSESPVELRLPLERGALRARAVDGRGTPVRGVTVALSAQDEETRHVETAQDGRFTLEGLPPVRFTLHARAEGRAFVTRDVEVGEDGVTDVGDLVVPSEAGLEVRVLRPDGTPWIEAPPVPWLWRGGEVVAGSNRIEYALRNGVVCVHGLAPGIYELRAPLGDGLTFVPRTVELQSGVVTRVELQMHAGRALTLLLEAPPAGSAPSGLELTVRDRNGTEALRRLVLPPSFLSSKWLVEHTFPPGSYTAAATGPDGTQWHLEFEVRLEVEQEARIVIPRR
jgi:RNA polymerase sigma factor (sigma-70 family)